MIRLNPNEIMRQLTAGQFLTGVMTDVAVATAFTLGRLEYVRGQNKAFGSGQYACG